MKQYLFIFSFLLIFSCSSFAANRQKKDPGINTTETTGKADSSSKKSAKHFVSKQPASVVPPGNTPKLRKDNIDETGEYYGPLSWKPALQY